MGLLNPGGPIAQFKRNRCSISPVELILQSGVRSIGFGLASNHAFIDGNKRIGAMVTQLLLKWNGYQFQLEQNELADMFIGIADGTKDETELRYWINDHIE